MTDAKRVMITSALPYINGIKHIGNLVGSMLPADVYARYLRQTGREVIYICATDEHGTPAELAAREAGQDVADYCAEQHQVQKDIYEGFHIAFDHFGRSSNPSNHDLTQHFCTRLAENGLIEEHSIRQLYSPADDRYLPDRYVEGTCPHCGYEKARGDQCESCTRVLEPADLVTPRSAISGSTDLEVRETKHLFLKQSAMADRLRQWIDSHGDWPHLVTSIAYKWLDEGIRDRGITRDLSWGVPVNRPGFEGKVFYVWFDAPIAYIAATRDWAEQDPARRDWKSWWYDADETVHYVQFMAKDNIPFHTISFPATCMGSGEPWKLVDQLKGFNWLTYYGGKFSTSSKRGIFTDQALEEFPADQWRYWLMANAPEGGDSSFTFDRFADQVNKDLAHVLGNFVNRSMKFCAKKFGEQVPEAAAFGAAEEALVQELEPLIADYRKHMDAMEFRKAMAALRAIWAAGNGYLTEAAPWTTVKTDEAAAKTAINVALNLARLFAVLSHPVIPGASATIRAAFGEGEASDTGTPPLLPEGVRPALSALPAGTPFTPIPPLFQPIDGDRVAQLTEKYGAPEAG
ncbi:methionine--tRNA ligase [Yunchengibacter salinarum]|uniref:methionine--tRNA ligase n=1 Tax=Yunchengibacter salinarum TaxID=3133399 RepID=UPI0035B6890F